MCENHQTLIQVLQKKGYNKVQFTAVVFPPTGYTAWYGNLAMGF
jgi:hypothetical protein